MVKWVLFSIPLDADTMIVSGEISPWIFFPVSRITCDGTTTSTRSFPLTTTARSLEGTIFLERETPGRKTLFSLEDSICSFTSFSNTHKSILKPFSPRRLAKAVPQLPAPTTPIFILSTSTFTLTVQTPFHQPKHLPFLPATPLRPPFLPDSSR